MSINWSELEAKYSTKRVEDGEYTTQVTKAEVSNIPSQSGNYAINFELKELNGVKFPYSSSHWISFKENGDDWRHHHMKSLLLDMGVSEENARKHIDSCEEAGDKDQIVEAYRKMFKTLASKLPKAKVKVETQPYLYTYKENNDAKGKKAGDKEIRLNGHRTEFAGESYMSPQTVENLQKRYPGVPIEGEQKIESIDDLGGLDADINLSDISF